eukprot:Gb_07729 [translate_table: standard]
MPKAATPHMAHPVTLCKQGRLKEAFNVLHIVDHVDSSTYASLLQGCLNIKALSGGKLVHAHMMKTGYKPDISLGTKLLILYAKCGCLVDARQVLDEIPEPNVVSWTAMIAAYSRHGYGQEALTLFYQMQRTGVRPNQFTFASVLPACASLGALEHGKDVHKELMNTRFESDIFVANALIDMYAKCGCLEEARHVFDKITKRDVVSWSSIIAGYVQNGNFDEALKLFGQMLLTGVKSNSTTFASVLPACANLAALEHGKQVHEDIIRSGFESDIFVGNALLDMYAKCRSIEDARKVFNKMLEQNVVSWNAMIAGYAQNGYVEEALKLFEKMPKRDLISWNVMITGYAQNGYVDEAFNLFKKMPKQNVVSWNAMIAGYAQNGHFAEALTFFRQMKLTGVKPNTVTFASVLSVCANLAALQEGKKVHDDITSSGLQSDVFVGCALVDMYAKCGSIGDARDVFENLPERTVVSWNALIIGYAMHGCGKECLQLFEQMQHSGIMPNHVTFVGVLSACCHAGLVDDGLQYFDRMAQEYHITPALEHCCCLVDLLGRAGRLDDALDFINKMPIKPDAAVWGSLLGACRTHGNVDLGECVAERLFELESDNSANYVLLSNIYGAAGKWDDKEKVRKMMKDKRVKKTPGRSWIEVNNKVYTFLVGDRSHPQTQKIYAELERLFGQMKEAGYVSDTNFVLHDVEEEQKEHILSHHSEKLAVAFGLINTSPGTPIRVVKNLRVCGDCHSVIKFISKIVARDIVLRDANRFHHFKDGQCSCRDYW